MKLKEIWKDIPGFEGLYQVSNLARVRSLNYNKTGKIKILKLIINNGYLSLALHKNGKQKMCLVHRLVYVAFKGPIPDGMTVDHINGIKTDNRLENLQLLTRGENARKANLGSKHSEETKAKISAANLGKPCWNKGKKRKPFTDEHKAKMSLAAKARWQKKINLGN